MAGVHSQRKQLRNCDKFRKSDVISIDAFQFSKFFRVLEFHSLQVARNLQEIVTFKSVMTPSCPSQVMTGRPQSSASQVMNNAAPPTL